MASTSVEKQLRVGDVFPDAVSTCIENTGKAIKVLEHVPCVLFFYPEAPEKQSTFQGDFNLPYPLLTFTTEQIETIGLTRENGKVVRGHLILGQDGKVTQAEYTISPEESFEHAVAYVKKSTATEPTKAAAETTTATPATLASGSTSKTEREEEEDEEDGDDGGGLASLLGGDIDDDDSDSDDFVPGEEEDDDALIEDDADDDDAQGAAATDGGIAKKPRLA